MDVRDGEAETLVLDVGVHAIVAARGCCASPSSHELPFRPSRTTWLRCDFVGRRIHHDLPREEAHLVGGALGSKRRTIGITSGARRFPSRTMESEHLLRSAARRPGRASGTPTVTPASVVTHSSSHCLLIATSRGKSHGRSTPSIGGEAARSTSVLASANATAAAARRGSRPGPPRSRSPTTPPVLDPERDRLLIEVQRRLARRSPA